jgi:hypothetical protein
MDQSNGNASNEFHSRILKRWIPWNQVSYRQNEVNYTRKTITQASDLNEKIESLDIARSTCTIYSIDVKKMYPTTTFGLIKRAGDYFSSDFLPDEKETTETCLEMIQFGMSNTLVTFQDKYYEYGGSDNDSKGLTIEVMNPHSWQI